MIPTFGTDHIFASIGLDQGDKSSWGNAIRAIVDCVRYLLSVVKPKFEANILNFDFIWAYMHLVLSLVTPPQVTEQEVHELQDPTLQSTEDKK